ncbi:MAG: glycosyltransferase [Alphaproteobacteria bacterium]|nr:glycosyltransferase [Alphaproteobacteria bacterium]
MSARPLPAPPSPSRHRRITRVLINGLHAKSGGGVTYLRNIVPHLADDPRLELHLFLHVDQSALFLPVDERVRVHLLDFRSSFWRRLLWEQVCLPFRARAISADVTFSPANFGPLFVRNAVILLRNAIAVGNAERRLGKRLYWMGLTLMTAASLLACRRAIAVSAYARDALTFGSKRRAACKISIVHHGADERFAPGTADHEEGRPFLLAVSDIYVQKNFHTLIRALPKIRARVPGLTLRIAGRPVDGDYFRDLQAIVAHEGLSDAVEFLGSQPLERLIALYRGCAVFVFPSTVETFGNPLVEAMRCGAAIACSNTTAMPEVVGDAALLFDPVDADDMARRIIEILTDPVGAAVLRGRAIEQGRRYSWAKTARKTADVLIGAAGNDNHAPLTATGQLHSRNRAK